MAEQENDQQDNDELGGLTEDDAKRLLDKPKNESGKKDEDDDPDGADQLGDAGRRALDSIKEQRRAAREERDRLKTELEQVRGQLRQHSDKDKSEMQRLQEERDSLKARVEKSEAAMKRRELAEDLAPDHATPAQIRQVAKRLTGDTDDALKADAEELYALIAPAPSKTPPASKPKERLRGGGDPDDGSDEPNRKTVLERIPRSRF